MILGERFEAPLLCLLLYVLMELMIYDSQREVLFQVKQYSPDGNGVHGKARHYLIFLCSSSCLCFSFFFRRGEVEGNSLRKVYVECLKNVKERD